VRITQATVWHAAKLAVAVLALTLAVSQPACASFKVFPTTVDLERGAGSAALGTINVRVHGERGRRFRTIVQEITQRPDGTQAYSPASNSRFSASSWVSVTPSTFSGSPDRTQPVQYRVIVPPNAEPGDHLASLTVQRLASGGGATATSIEAVSVRMTIRVRGTVHPEARIVSLEVPTIADGGPVSITTTVRNSGNVTLDFDHANPGAMNVLDGDDQKASLPFEGRLFPGQTRVFTSSWDDPPLFGNFDAEASIKTGTRDARRKEGFWVVPWRQIAALLLVLLAALIFALGWRRRRWGY
jgi:hypothetical protein